MWKTALFINQFPSPPSQTEKDSRSESSDVTISSSSGGEATKASKKED